MATLEELALRCEQAERNSWDLDREIFKATGGLPDVWFGSKVISWFGDGPYGCNTEDGRRHLDCLNAPNYTASIDTAMTLVPEGVNLIDLKLSWDTAAERAHPACSVKWYEPGATGNGWHACVASGKTAALAIANAALQLRARSSS